MPPSVLVCRFPSACSTFPTSRIRRFWFWPSYGVFYLNDSYDIDPLLAGLMITPLLFVFGLVAYRIYYETFERRGSDAGVRGIAFLFGIAFIIEVLIILQFGVDQRSVSASYIGKAWRIGDMRIPVRLRGRLRGGLGADHPADAVSVADLHGTRDPRGRAGPGGAAADGRQPGQDQAMGVRHCNRGARDRRAPCSLSLRRSIRRSTAPISAALSASW